MPLKQWGTIAAAGCAAGLGMGLGSICVMVLRRRVAGDGATESDQSAAANELVASLVACFTTSAAVSPVVAPPAVGGDARMRFLQHLGWEVYEPPNWFLVEEWTHPTDPFAAAVYTEVLSKSRCKIVFTAEVCLLNEVGDNTLQRELALARCLEFAVRSGHILKQLERYDDVNEITSFHVITPSESHFYCSVRVCTSNGVVYSAALVSFGSAHDVASMAAFKATLAHTACPTDAGDTLASNTHLVCHIPSLRCTATMPFDVQRAASCSYSAEFIEASKAEPLLSYRSHSTVDYGSYDVALVEMAVSQPCLSAACRSLKGCLTKGTVVVHEMHKDDQQQAALILRRVLGKNERYGIAFVHVPQLKGAAALVVQCTWPDACPPPLRAVQCLASRVTVSPRLNAGMGRGVSLCVQHDDLDVCVTLDTAPKAGWMIERGLHSRCSAEQLSALPRIWLFSFQGTVSQRYWFYRESASVASAVESHSNEQSSAWGLSPNMGPPNIGDSSAANPVRNSSRTIKAAALRCGSGNCTAVVIRDQDAAGGEPAVSRAFLRRFDSGPA